MKSFVTGVLMACLVASTVFATEKKPAAKPKAAKKIASGLKLGAHPEAFNVYDVTGPNRGTTLCYRCAYGDLPTISVFTRKVDDEVVQLIKSIDASVKKNKAERMSAFVVYLSDDPDEAEDKLKALAKNHAIKNVPLTTYDGEVGPEEYKISLDADLSVMMWVDSDVKVNAAFTKGRVGSKNLKTLVESTKKILE